MYLFICMYTSSLDCGQRRALFCGTSVARNFFELFCLRVFAAVNCAVSELNAFCKTVEFDPFFIIIFFALRFLLPVKRWSLLMLLAKTITTTTIQQSQ